MISFLTHRSPIFWSSSLEKTLPTGLSVSECQQNVPCTRRCKGSDDERGVLRTIILVFGVMARSSSSKSMVQLAADDVAVAPSEGGCRGT